MDFLALAQQCAPSVSPHTIAAIVQVESNFNPYAIGVVGGSLKKQPTSKEEALRATKQLLSENKNFSVGIAQINRHNLPAYSATFEQAFDACKSLNMGAQILEKCYVKAKEKFPKEDEQYTLKMAFSCYYSGNFLRGFKPDKAGDISYVDKIVNAAMTQSKKQRPIVPAIAVPTPSTNSAKKNYPVLIQFAENINTIKNKANTVLIYSRSDTK